MSRAPDIHAVPGPECVCGAEIKKVPLPEDLLRQMIHGREYIWVHVENGDTRCYPDDPTAAGATAEPMED